MKTQFFLAIALTFGLAGGFATAALAGDDGTSTTDTQEIGSDQQTGGATQQDRDTMSDIQSQIDKQKQEQQEPQPQPQPAPDSSTQ